jgi:EAL domain-containing protein (putative c-di-GMP-specific phosphodiesterase class I)
VPSVRAVLAAAGLAIVIPLLVGLVSGADPGDDATLVLVGSAIVAGYSLVAALAFTGAFGASQRADGLEARTWWLLSLGLLCWTGGGISYLAFLYLGGDPEQPAAWSQIGYLLAYPFWYLALWHLRQPVLATSRGKQVEALAVELAALVMLGTAVAGVLWHPPLPILENVAQLIPALLDVLLLAAFYGAVRRSSWSRRTALTWLGYAFATLAITDQIVTYMVTRGHLLVAFPVTLVYVLAMAMIAIAALHPLRAAEAQGSVRTTTTSMAIIGLALVGVASATAPSELQPLIWVVGAWLAWRALELIGDRESSDADVLTGFLETRAFERHLGGVIQNSGADRRSVLIAIDFNGFGAWNARNGYAAGDALVERAAKALHSNGPPSAVWGRIALDRFAFTVNAHDERDDRALAERLRREASLAAEQLEARAALVVLPVDASNAAEALEALDETLRAALEAERQVVAYTRGELDGLMVTPGSASRAQRRERIQDVIASEEALTSVLQPIVRLGDLKIQGFEALARFHAEPQQGPDKWINEATQLGLGIDLEIECLRRAWARLEDVPDSTYISINASPDALMSDALLDTFSGLDLHHLVVEVTEHERVKNYPRLASRLASLRGRGARIAIDDTGAGHASLSHLIELRPDYIKLDRKLVQGLDTDPGKHALVRNMLRLAGDLGAKMVAEGIETEGELAALRGLDVPLGQGYLLGRPTPDIAVHIEQLGIVDPRAVESPTRELI